MSHWWICCAGPLSSFPSIKQLSNYQVRKWEELGHLFDLTLDQIIQTGKSRYPTTEVFLAAKIKNMDLKWKDILQALLKIEEYEVADHVCSDQGLLISLHERT